MSFCSNRIFLVVAGCLAVGAASGYFARISLGSSDVESVADAPVAARRAILAAEDENSECRRLQEKAKRLERELDGIVKVDGRAQDEGGKAAADGDESATVDEAVAKCKTHGEWKRRFPKLYEQQRKLFSRHVAHQLGNYEKWRQFMASVDVSGLAEEERSAHGELMETYARVYELLKENLNSEEDDNRTLEQESRNSKEIERLREKGAEMMATERNILMGAVAENLGRRLGWQGEDIAAFAETLRAIADVTAKDVQR